MKFDAILWDVDGTIIESEGLYNQSIRYATHQCGAKMQDVTDAQLSGLHMKDVWNLVKEKIEGKYTYQYWLDILENYYIDHKDSLISVKNSADIIRLFYQQGLKQGCVSNSSRRIIDVNLERIGISKEIQFIVSVDDVANGKPDPEPYLKALNILQSKRVIAIEDSLTGVTSAQLANITVVKYIKADESYSGLRVSHLDELKELIL